jgi:hypothetical protein
VNNQADGDSDGDSDGDDLLIWQRGFQPPASATSAVPEPTLATILLGVLAVVGASRRT